MTLEDLRWFDIGVDEITPVCRFVYNGLEHEIRKINGLIYMERGPYTVRHWEDTFKIDDDLSLLCRVIEIPLDQVVWWEQDLANEIASEVGGHGYTTRSMTWQTLIDKFTSGGNDESRQQGT